MYTKPDITSNRSPFLILNARHNLSSALSISANAYYRYVRTRAFSGDLNEASLDQSLYQLSAADIRALTAAGYTGFPLTASNASNTPFPFWRCTAQALQRDEPGEKCNALLNNSMGKQYSYGASGQLTWRKSRSQLTIGTGIDHSDVDYLQSTQLGYLNPDRSMTGVNAFADGVTGGSVDGEPFDLRVDLHGAIHTWSLYAMDTIKLARAWSLTVSGRYNHTSITNADRIRASGPGTLSGLDRFSRLNPAAGVTYNPSGFWNAYAGYSEGSRGPTSIELGCADPNQPCKLPNSMAGDPPLKKVVVRTWEAGLRAGEGSPVNWNIGWFRAENHDDILFVATEQAGFGYFRNFGRTRRQGLDAGLSKRIHKVTLGGSYTFLEATYQSPEVVAGSSNSRNDAPSKGLDGNVRITPGDHIPLVPQHLLKAHADVEVTSKLSAVLGLVAISSSFARGNENNLHQPDGLYYLGSGKSPGYTVLNLRAQYQLHRRLSLFLQLNNLLDRRYYTGAQLGPTGFTDSGSFVARPLPPVGADYPLVHATFLAPGAPRGAWGGLRVRF